MLYVLRARHVIDDLRANKSMVAEEILLRGLAGMERRVVEDETLERLMADPKAAGDLPRAAQKTQLERELSEIENLRPSFDALALKRAGELIRQHERYYKALGSDSKSERFRVVEPVIPMDILGIYIFLPGGAS